MWISMEDMVKQKKNATFGGRLKMAREDASLTQEELAALLQEHYGVSVGRSYLRTDDVLLFIRHEMTRLTAADVDALAAADDTSSRTQAGIAAARREIARLTRSLQDADDDRYVHGTLDTERHARTVQRLQAEIDNQQAEIGRLEDALRREAETGTRRERLLDVLQNGAAVLESADRTAANAWLRTHLRVWADGEMLLVDWSLDWRPV